MHPRISWGMDFYQMAKSEHTVHLALTKRSSENEERVDHNGPSKYYHFLSKKFPFFTLRS